MGRIKKLLVTATAAAIGIAVIRRFQGDRDAAVNLYEAPASDGPTGGTDSTAIGTFDGVSAEDTTSEEEKTFEEGDQRVELEAIAYDVVVDEYGADTSIKSNTLDKDGAEPFDDEIDGYQPTLQVTADSRFILQTGTEGTITEDTLETFVQFRKSGYRRLLLVPDDDVESVEELVEDNEAAITVCSPDTLADEL